MELENKAKIAQTDPALQSSAEQGPELPKPEKTKTEKPEKSGKGSKIALTLTSILALAGIGFGVYEYIQNSDKVVKISELSAKLDLIKTEAKTELVDKDEGGVTQTYVESVEEVDSEDFIYIGEWGIKIKIPENLTLYRYTYSPYHGTGVIDADGSEIQSSTLCVNAATKGHESETPSFINSCMYTISKNIGQADEGSGAFWQYTVPSGEFYSVGPQAMMGDESQKDWELESVNAISDWLADKTARSAI